MEFRYEHNETDYSLTIEPQADGTYRAKVGDNTYQVEVQRSQSGQLNLLINGQRILAYTANQKNHHFVALVDRQARHYEFSTAQATRRKGTSSEGGSLKAQMPGQVIQVMVSEGDAVEKGQALLILEAMKMEIRMVAPSGGKVTRLLVKQGETVERGQQLIELHNP